MLSWLAEPWQSPLVARGGLTAILVGVPAAGIGCWVILRDLPYAAESLAHGMFPGLVAATLLGLPLALGAVAGVAVAAAAMVAARLGGAEADTAVAVAVTPLVGLGAILGLSGASPPGVSSFLFGDVLATGPADALAALVFACSAMVALRAAHWRLLAAGLLRGRETVTEIIALVLLAMATVAAARCLGTLLALSLILGPAAASRSLSRRAGPMILVAMAIAATAVPVGIEASWHLDWAVGPSIAICAIIPAVIAWLAGLIPVSPGTATRTARIECD